MVLSAVSDMPGRQRGEQSATSQSGSAHSGVAVMAQNQIDVLAGAANESAAVTGNKVL